MLLYTRLAPPKAPKKRSRAGCTFCKEKKKKCDETRPQCARCVENSQECVYEPIKPRQRRKRSELALDTNFPRASAERHSSSSPQSGISINQWEEQQRLLHGHSHGYQDMLDDDALSAVDPSNRHIQHIPASLSGVRVGHEMQHHSFAWSPPATTTYSPITPSTFEFPGLDEEHLLNGDNDIEEIVRNDAIMTSSSCNSIALAAGHLPSPTLEFCSPLYGEFSERRNRRVLVDHFCNVLSHLIVLREENGNPFQQLVLPLGRRSPAVMDAIYALASAHLEFRGVETGEKSEQFHARAIQSLAMLIEQGKATNKNELLATIMLLVYYEVLVQKQRSNIVHGHLKGAMTIMNDRETSTDPTGVFLERAFRFYDVIAALSFGTTPQSSAPGCGALSTFSPLDSRGTASPSGSVDTLLGMSTTLWPIIHRLSNLVGLNDELDEAIAEGKSSKIAVLRTELETTASAIQVALQQWQPILPPGCNLDKDPKGLAPDKLAERARLQSILNNALAYRHSAFVYLYRTIHRRSRHHPLVQQHTHASLTHCLGSVSGDGPRGALLWPLFVAACEATTAEDRGMARQAFADIDHHQGMTNIERSWCIVQEVWRRSDEAELTMLRPGEDEEDVDEQGSETVQPSGCYKRAGGGRSRRTAKDLWRRVSKDMGVTVVFG